MRDRRFGLVLTTDEYLSLELVAEIDGASLASVVRRLIRREARKLGIWQDIILGKYEGNQTPEEMLIEPCSNDK